MHAELGGWESDPIRFLAGICLWTLDRPDLFVAKVQEALARHCVAVNLHAAQVGLEQLGDARGARRLKRELWRVYEEADSFAANNSLRHLPLFASTTRASGHLLDGGRPTDVALEVVDGWCQARGIGYDRQGRLFRALWPDLAQSWTKKAISRRWARRREAR